MTFPHLLNNARTRLITLALLAGAVVATHASANRAALDHPAGADADQAGVVGPIVAGLASPSWAERRRAERAVVRLHTAFLPAIEAAAGGQSGHVAATLASAAADMRDRLLAQGRMVRGSGADVPAGAAVAHLAAEAGVQLACTIDAATPVLWDNAATSFWDALIALCAENDWDVAASAGGSRKLMLTVTPAGPESRQLNNPIRVTGPAAVVVRSAERRSTADFRHNVAGPDAGGVTAYVRHEGVRFELEALLEPRFQIGPRDFRVIWTRASDADGRSLLRASPPQPDAEPMPTRAVVDAAGGIGRPEPAAREHVTAGTWSAGRLRFGVDLHPPGGEASASGITLAGRIEGLVGGELDRATHAGEGESVWLIAGEPVTVRLERGTAGESETRWHLRLRSGRPLAFDIRRLIIESLDDASLVTGGRAIRRTSARVNDQPDGLSVDLDFVAPTDTGVAAHVECEVPRRAVRLSLPFRFDGLPMP